jgi:predicted secreted protein
MGWVSGVVTYLVIWWIVLFMVLPWGVQRPDSPEPGHETGAPAKPRVFTKMAITTGVATVLFGIVWAIHEAGIFSFRDIVS